MPVIHLSFVLLFLSLFLVVVDASSEDHESIVYSDKKTLNLAATALRHILPRNSDDSSDSKVENTFFADTTPNMNSTYSLDELNRSILLSLESFSSDESTTQNDLEALRQEVESLIKSIKGYCKGNVNAFLAHEILVELKYEYLKTFDLRKWQDLPLETKLFETMKLNKLVSHWGQGVFPDLMDESVQHYPFFKSTAEMTYISALEEVRLIIEDLRNRASKCYNVPTVKASCGQVFRMLSESMASSTEAEYYWKKSEKLNALGILNKVICSYNAKYSTK